MSDRRSGNNTYSDGLQGSKSVEGGTDLGRHPANLILDGSPEVVAMFPAKAGAAAPVKGTEPSGVTKDIYGTFFGDQGSAARFFHQFPRHACELCEDLGYTVTAGDWSNPYGEQEQCKCGGPLKPVNPLIYQSKAGKLDRGGGNHPTVKPIALMQYLIRHITPPGGIVLDPFAGSGTTAEAARREGMDCILMEAEPEYVDFLRKRFTLPGATFDQFDDLLGEALPEMSTACGQFEDLLG